MKYPTRARIIDVVGQRLAGYQLLTPEVSRPYVGKEGLAEEVAVPWPEAELKLLRNTTPEEWTELGMQPMSEEELQGLEELTMTQVRITLDDGSILWGYECWWEPVKEEHEQGQTTSPAD